MTEPVKEESQTGPIPEDLREEYKRCNTQIEMGFLAVHAKRKRELIERIGRAEASVAELKDALQNVVNGNDLALERNHSISNWRNSDFRDQAIKAISRATGKES